MGNLRMKMSLVLVLVQVMVCPFLWSPVEGNLSPGEKLRSEALTNLWLHNNTDTLYHDCADLGNGQGLTCGRANFTTSYFDLRVLVKEYSKRKPQNPLTPYLPELERLARLESSDTSNLGGFTEIWASESDDPTFRETQDWTLNEVYYEPAMGLASALNVQLPLTKAVLYDTIIQHGDREDPDSIRYINNMAGPPPESVEEEKQWLARFLSVRRQVLLNPTDESLKSWWPATADTVEGYFQLLNEGNFLFLGPFRIQTSQHEAFIE
jgi:chitosanase